MDRGNPKLKLTKTDFARYLNANSEQYPELSRYYERYMERCGRARKMANSQFGFWLRDNHSERFNKAYRAASKHPELLAEIYPDDADSQATVYTV